MGQSCWAFLGSQLPSSSGKGREERAGPGPWTEALKAIRVSLHPRPSAAVALMPTDLSLSSPFESTVSPALIYLKDLHAPRYGGGAALNSPSTLLPEPYLVLLLRPHSVVLPDLVGPMKGSCSRVERGRHPPLWGVPRLWCFWPIPSLLGTKCCICNIHIKEN